MEFVRLGTCRYHQSLKTSELYAKNQIGSKEEKSTFVEQAPNLKVLGPDPGRGAQNEKFRIEAGPPALDS